MKNTADTRKDKELWTYPETIAYKLGFEPDQPFIRFCKEVPKWVLTRAYGITFDRPGLSSPLDKKKYFIGTVKSLLQDQEENNEENTDSL